MTNSPTFGKITQIVPVPIRDLYCKLHADTLVVAMVLQRSHLRWSTGSKRFEIYRVNVCPRVYDRGVQSGSGAARGTTRSSSSPESDRSKQ